MAGVVGSLNVPVLGSVSLQPVTVWAILKLVMAAPALKLPIVRLPAVRVTV